ncbi:MAG: hypothetical protein ABIO60_03030 [Aquaticitalea sp.]
MQKSEPKKQNAVQALLDIYKNAVQALQRCIEDLKPDELCYILDAQSDNPDCHSIQTILAHVIRSGIAYNVYIQNIKDPRVQRPERIQRETVEEYLKD